MFSFTKIGIVLEMICESCVKKHEFLLHYDEACKKLQTEDKQEEIDPVSEEEASDDKDVNYCKQPKEKSEKLCAKFWSDVRFILVLTRPRPLIISNFRLIGVKSFARATSA